MGWLREGRRGGRRSFELALEDLSISNANAKRARARASTLRTRALSAQMRLVALRGAGIINYLISSSSNHAKGSRRRRRRDLSIPTRGEYNLGHAIRFFPLVRSSQGFFFLHILKFIWLLLRSLPASLTIHSRRARFSSYNLV